MSLIGAGYLGFALIHLEYDKVIHFTTFLILTIEFYFIFDTKNKKLIRIITIVICTCGASIGLELIQHLINSQRIFDIFDILYNVCGSSIGLLIACIVHNWRISKMRQEKQRRRQIDHIEGQSISALDNQPILLDDQEEGKNLIPLQDL